MSTAAKRLGIDWTTVRAWIISYKSNGLDAFTHVKNSIILLKKNRAVIAYLSGEGSLNSISQRFGLRSNMQLRDWIKRYNSHEELKTSGTGGCFTMTKGRKTTFDERVEIVQYCIAHNHNYAETANKYNVSYQQARNYTVKYESSGLDALRDNRGKRKAPDTLTEVERLRAELKIEHARRMKAEMEASFLKKIRQNREEAGLSQVK